MDVDALVGSAINGVVLGGIIALAAIGLSLVYGILRISNFAHGDLLTLGAYVVFGFNAFYAAGSIRWPLAITAALLGVLAWRTRVRAERVGIAAVAAVLLLLAAWPTLADGGLGRHFLAASVLSMVWTSALLVGLDLALWRPLRKQGASVVTMIITSIGIALLLRNIIAMVFGTSLHSYARPIRPPMELIGFRITEVQIWTLVACGLLVAGVHLMLQYTRFGKSLRAVADDPELARISGIDVDRMVRYVWILAGALAAFAGILLALNVNININLGWRLILPIFAAVILGGVGNIYGALLGAFIISIAMEVSVLFLPDAGYRLAVGFLILIATILWRPQGLMSR